ncbi:porin family protein [Mucilaginibacter ximonensis]|uniref:Porin family protein n=1 Tax=Mucilaginibacter ximonensis TaxID=538021 RepID=A0ABW5YGY7_9SPHI
MKNLVLSCALACASILASINQSFAQSTKARWGIKGGLNVTTLGSYNDAARGVRNYSYRPGFQAGVVGVLPFVFSDKFDFMPELFYSQKGAKATKSYIVGDIVSGADYKISMDYIDVPFLVGFKPRPDLTFTLGPQLSFLVSQKTTVNYGNTESSSSNTSGYRKVSYGGNLGMAVAINPDFMLGLNYMYDFQHIYSPGVADGGYDLHSPERNSGFALTVSYLFN